MSTVPSKTLFGIFKGWNNLKDGKERIYRTWGGYSAMVLKVFFRYLFCYENTGIVLCQNKGFVYSFSVYQKF